MHAVQMWAADSPLVRLLLSMYIAQQNTNPVIKETLVRGRSGSPVHSSRRNRFTHTPARTHTRTLVAAPDWSVPTHTPTVWTDSRPKAAASELIKRSTHSVGFRVLPGARAGGGSSAGEGGNALSLSLALSLFHFGFLDNQLREREGWSEHP